MTHRKLSDIPAYRISFKLSNTVWEIIIKWDWVAKKTVGVQFIEAVDSISANIAEGFGRFHKKDKCKFFYNSRATVYESLDWLQKAKVRKLISEKEYVQIFDTLQILPKEINYLIKCTYTNLTK